MGIRFWLHTLAILTVVSAAMAADPAPSVRWTAKYTNLTLPVGFEAMMVWVDFPPGALFPLHHHGGPVVAMVVEGEITLTQNGISKVYKVGESFTEPPGQIHQAQNRGSAKAAVVVTYLLPQGAQPDIFVNK